MLTKNLIVCSGDVAGLQTTRLRICRSLAMLKDKKLDNPWRKHGNIPL